MYEEYASIDAQIASLESKKKELRASIIQDMIARGVDKEKHSLGSFSVTKLKKWTYPESVIELGEQFKAEKAKAESTGDATFTEEESLRFTSVKL